MAGHTKLWLLLVVPWLCVTDTYGRYPSITLPDWMPNADYVTRCNFDNNMSPFCDWRAEGLTRHQTGPEKFYISRDPVSPLGVARLQSTLLYFTEDSCLEFWFYKPGQHSPELRVLLSNDTLEIEIWSSRTAESHAWRQVLIPLSSLQHSGLQIVFELTQGQGTEEEVIIDMIGLRKGQCGPQCQSDAPFQTDESSQCACIENQLTCTQITCGVGETCSQTIGSTSGTCRVARDLRYTTFDGVNFRFMGPCTYILTKVCDRARVLPEFVVEVQKEQKSNSLVSSIQQVNLKLQGMTVTLLRRERKKVMVNGIWRNLPLNLDTNTVKINAQGPTLKLQTHFNLSISYHVSGAVQVTVPDQFSGKLCGMCGNFNHVMDDDNIMLDGSPAENVQAFGQSWKSEDAPCQEPIQSSTCSEAEKLEYASEAYCGVLLSHYGPFSECSSALGAMRFFKSCEFEMCSTKGNSKAFCDVLQDFTQTCTEAGIPVTGWRNETYCPLACGPNSHFNACSSDCPATCSSLDATETCGSCEERCECDNGFLLSGGTCVPAEDCGCWVDGQHYEKGQTFMESDCERLCLCRGHGNFQCSAASCLANEVCKIKDEVLGCFPSSPVTCSVYGDPHYISFDGKAYSFRGTCNYTIAKTYTANGASFTITARNEDRGKSSSLNSVALNVEGLHLVIRKNKLVYVNGGQVTLPYSHSSSVNMSQAGPYVQVDTNFGLRLLFNGNDRLFVQVDERHKGKMYGLCGTYSGSQFDDFLTPDGSVVPFPHDFASSWNTHDSDWICSNGPPVDPACPPELDTEGFKECSKLFGDAFKACHWFVPPQIFVNSCVYDHCITGGDQTQLCNSLQNYVAACEVAEVFLGEWWKDTVCAIIPTTPPTTVPPTSAPTDPTTPTPSVASCLWSCNFDRDECGWEQLIQDSFDWTRWSGSTPTDITGPTSDHTTGSGFYMYIEADGVHHGDSARMMSPVCNALGTQCLTFWYHMYGGATAMALNVYKLDGSRATKIWSRVNNQGDLWHQAQIEIISTGPFQIIMEGIRGSYFRSDAAWDDITITYGKCRDISVDSKSEAPLPTSGSLPLITSALIPSTLESRTVSQPGSPSIYHPVCRMDCNFESDLCTWNQMLTDVFDWTRHSGSTPTSQTGPSSDHTTGSGHYIYIEGDSASHGDTARLLSEDCSDRQPQCLQFWYHMFGSSWTMGLTVYLLHGNQATEIWRKREDQGNTWHHALVDILPQDNFRIIFEGRRGAGARSDVSVDDISLHRGSCADVFNHVDASLGLERTNIGAIVNLAIPVTSTASCQWSCNFDQNNCGWEQLLQDSFDWTRWSGSTPTDLTGPTSDHTTGSGFYMYIEADGVHHGDSARMMSPVCNALGTQCLTFWYHMYGGTTAMALNVYNLVDNRATKIWSRVSNQGNHWHLAQIEIISTGPFQIIIEGIRGSEAQSDVAWDDVTITHGKCGDIIVNPNPESSPTSGGLPFITTALSNIDSTASQPGDFNNYNPVCRMDCNFESSLCTWNQMLTDVFDWRRHSGSTPTSQTGPSSDHTTGSGHYIYIEGDSASHGDTARLLSEDCSDRQPQCLQFWYHMFGSSWTMGLTVYLLHGNQATEIWRKREGQGNTWHHALVDILPQDNFRIIFEGRRGDNAKSDVAVDDVSLHRGTCEDLINHATALPTLEESTVETTVTYTTSTPQPTTETTIFECITVGGQTTTEEPDQSTAKPLQTTEEPVQSTAEPLRTTEEPVQSTAEPLQTTEEHVQSTAEPLQTTEEHVQSTAEPLQTTEAHVQTTTELIQTTEEHVQSTNKPLQTSEEPVQTTTVQSTTEPFQTTDTTIFECITVGDQITEEPVQSTVEHLQTTEEHVQSTAEPLQTTEVPVQTTTELIQTTEEHVQSTNKPLQTSEEPVQTTTVQSTTEPLQTTDTTIFECITVGDQITEEPVQSTVEHLQTTEEHVQSTAEPLQTTEVPVQTTTELIQTTEEHVQSTNKPLQTSEEPVQTTTVQSTTEPLQTKYTTIFECITVGDQITEEPVQSTAEHLQTTEEPVQSTVEHLQTAEEPVQSTVEHLQTTEEPVQSTVEHLQTTEEHVQSTVEHLQTTEEHVQSTTKHFHTTEKPLQSTAEPLQPTPSCPTNSHYTDCIPTCQPTCSQLHGPPNCNADEPCVQGCVCDDGFVFKQNVCVPIRECGCQDHNGKNYHFGETWYSPHCTQKCECKEKHGEGKLQCRNNECDDDEVCLMSEQGDYSCKSTDFSECSIDDEPEYRTFDNLKHKFQGKNSYVLVQTSNLPKNIPEVYIVGINQKSREQENLAEEHDNQEVDDMERGGHDDSSEDHDSSEEDDVGRLRALKIRVYNHTVEFRERRRVMVNGVQANTPVSPTTGLKILKRFSRVYLKTDFGLSVEFNGKGKAEITLPYTYKTKVGGLCGNFDGIKNNDMMKPNGEQAKNVKEFGESWRAVEDKPTVRRRRRSTLLSILSGLIQ